MTTAMTTTRNWAWLSYLVLDSVLQNIVPLQDYLRFSIVCKPWHSAAEAQKPRRLTISPQKQVPLLMVPTENRSHKRCRLYSATGGNKILQTTVPVPCHRRCCGSFQGWLAFLEEDYCVTLYNPFTDAQIFLPPICPTTHLSLFVVEDQDFQYFAKKVVLSADPSTHPDDYMVAALINYPVYRTLSVIRPGKDDKHWTQFSKWTNYTGHEKVSPDLIFQDCWVYASALHGMLVRANVEGVVLGDGEF